MQTPPIVSPEEWETARQHMLVKEKEFTHARDALAAERRRMPWLAVEKEYRFEGPKGNASLLDLFDSRRQLIVYRAFFEPGVHGWPEHACIGCSMLADQVAHLAHLHARDTSLVFVSRAPQPDIERVKARMGWEMPWYERVHPRRRPRVPHLLHQHPRRRGDGEHLELPRPDCARSSRGVGGLAGGLSPDPAVPVVDLARRSRVKVGLVRTCPRQRCGRGAMCRRPPDRELDGSDGERVILR